MLRIVAALAALSAASALEATVRMQPVVDSPCVDNVKQYAVSSRLLQQSEVPQRLLGPSPSLRSGLTSLARGKPVGPVPTCAGRCGSAWASHPLAVKWLGVF